MFHYCVLGTAAQLATKNILFFPSRLNVGAGLVVDSRRSTFS